MLLAFSLLTIGYAGLGLYPTWLQSAGLVEYGTTTTFTGLLESNLRYGIIPIMILIVIGGSFIKSVISGTVAKETTPETRAKGFSIFLCNGKYRSLLRQDYCKTVARSIRERGVDHSQLFFRFNDIPGSYCDLVFL